LFDFRFPLDNTGGMLTLIDVTKDYRAPDGTRVPTLDVPAFALDRGEHVAVIGTSGSGKTTLLHLLAGILAPDAGSIVYAIQNGPPTDIARLTEAQRDRFRARHIGYIFQTHHLLAGFSALENVLLGMSFSGRGSDRPWATHLLERVGLADRLHYRPGKLSLGQQQRVAVARALANRPDLVLADEPTGALDPKTAGVVMELIRSLCQESGAALLVVTHDHGIARTFGRMVELAELNRAVSAAPAPGGET
jgi:ABC-type lipoprotein export system ATPase subunit